MDEFYMLWGLSLSAELLCTFACAVKYFHIRKLYKAFMTALNEGINRGSAADAANGHHLVLVRGNVKAIGNPIKSLNNSNMLGVIQKLTIKEHSVRQDGWGYWFPSQNIINSHVSVIPFVLKDGDFEVTVTSPLAADYLTLDIIEDHFEPSVTGFLSLLFGFHRRGYQYTELFLKENSILTGFGELTFNRKGELLLIPPKNGTGYILTTMDPETLSQELRLKKKFIGNVCVILVLISSCIVGIIGYKFWKERQRRLANEKLEAQINRQRIEVQNAHLNAESFTCIICATRPREIVALPCGHVCLCFDCSVLLQGKSCPICRQTMDGTHIVILS